MSDPVWVRGEVSKCCCRDGCQRDCGVCLSILSGPKENAIAVSETLRIVGAIVDDTQHHERTIRFSEEAGIATGFALGVLAARTGGVFRGSLCRHHRDILAEAGRMANEMYRSGIATGCSETIH